MATWFVSDLHLDQTRPHLTQAFHQLLTQAPNKCSALYILGDCFEVWLGSTASAAAYTETLTALHQATQKGLPIYIMAGNRDFLLDQTFLNQSGCQLLPDPFITNIAGTATLLSHGDLLCTDDLSYQRYRKVVHNRAIQWLFLHLPAPWQHAIGRSLRSNSQQTKSQKSYAIMDVNAASVQQWFQRYAVTRMIHGHTHRPAQHKLTVNHQPCLRIVLPDWHNKAVGLAIADDGTLSELPL